MCLSNLKSKIKKHFRSFIDYMAEVDKTEQPRIDPKIKEEIIAALNELEIQVDLKEKQKEMLAKIEGMKVDEKLIDDVLLSDYDLETLKSLLDIVD